MSDVHAAAYDKVVGHSTHEIGLEFGLAPRVLVEEHGDRDTLAPRENISSRVISASF
jgi:hypothetical protein